MGTYIFITHGIVNIGGGQLYVISKSKYLKEIGWNPIIISFYKGRLMIEEFKNYTNLTIPEIQIRPVFFTHKKVSNIIEKIKLLISDPYNKIIVESHSSTLSEWGEILAKSLLAKHIIYNINENIICTNEQLPFFLFKLQRRELAGISSVSLKKFFSPFFDIERDKSYYLLAYNNVDKIVDYNYLPINKIASTGKITICVIGRYEKEYITNTLPDISNFIDNNKDQSFNLIYIGDEASGNSIKKKIKKAYKGKQNVKLYQLGFLYPLPLSLIKIIDVAIASSGAVSTMYSGGIPTIAIDAKDCKPIGIYGFTTRHTLFRYDEPQTQTLSELLSTIISDKTHYVTPTADRFTSNKKMKTFDSHMDFISQSDQSFQYFDNFQFRKTLKNFVKLLVIHFGGAKAYISIFQRVK